MDANVLQFPTSKADDQSIPDQYGRIESIDVKFECGVARCLKTPPDEVCCGVSIRFCLGFDSGEPGFLTTQNKQDGSFVGKCSVDQHFTTSTEAVL